MKSIFYRLFDAHHHLRDGEMLMNILPFLTYLFSGAIIMPNLNPPVVTTKEVDDYRKRIMLLVPPETVFTPFMTTYLTEKTDPHDIRIGFNEGVFIAAKWYPPHGTTNSSHGVHDINKVENVLAVMEEIGMTLSVHGEEPPSSGIDIFDREKAFLERKLIPLLDKFPKLKVVLEHVTTKEAVQFVGTSSYNIGATITPQHLLFDRNALFDNGLHPDLYCMPILKRDIHKEAIQAYVKGGNPKFWLGTDSAPHLKENKYKDCGCAGVFSSPVTIPAYYNFFFENNITDKFQAFASDNATNFYGISLPEKKIKIIEREWIVPNEYHGITPLFAGQKSRFEAVALTA